MLVESFDSTYEGLKQVKGRAAQVMRECFDSTYEGLKHAVRPAQPLRHVGFDSTYEGLKLDDRAGAVEGVAVSTVPMRA